jgi:hypothetical protein
MAKKADKKTKADEIETITGGAVSPWVTIFKTSIEDGGGEHRLAEVQQHMISKDIRIV